MFLRFLANLLRRGAKRSVPAPPSIRPSLQTWLLADIPGSGPERDDNQPPSAVEQEKRNLLEIVTTAVPQLVGGTSSDHRSPNSSIRVELPQGLDVGTLESQLRGSRAFKWDQAGATSIKDEFYAHDLQCKPTLSGAWKTKSDVARARVVKSRAKTVRKASAWLESFISGADPKLLPRIHSSIDLESIWKQLGFIIDEALAGRDATLPDDVSSPASEKVDPAPDNTVFSVLGILHDTEDSCLKIYSVRLTGWAEYDAGVGLLRSGVKGVLKCVKYEEPPSGN